MTKSTRDIPNHEGMTVADRIKAARQDAEFTRKALADTTGIPASTLEKYERGDMDPNTTRLQTMCDHLGVSVNWVLNGDDAYEVSESVKPVREIQSSTKVAETTKTAETQSSANVAVTSTEVPQIASQANENDPLEHARWMLSDLDDMGGDDFNGTQRGAMALVNEIQVTLKHLEPDDLLFLTKEHDLHQDEENLDTSGILELFANDHDEGEAYCESITDRILDTCILGIDLFRIERGPLVDIANAMEEEHGIESTKFFGWGKHSDFVPLIRPHLWAMAIYSDGYDFEDEEKFPKRDSPTNQKEKTKGFDPFIL